MRAGGMLSREVEEVAGIRGDLDALSPGQMGAVIGMEPVGQIRIDIVLVREATGERAHGLPGIIEPGTVGSDDRGRIARVPASRILRRHERGVGWPADVYKLGGGIVPPTQMEGSRRRCSCKEFPEPQT